MMFGKKSLPLETISSMVSTEVAFHARTQTRYVGPGNRVAWHCDCKAHGVGDGRSGAIREHRDHVKSVIEEIFKTLGLIL